MDTLSKERRSWNMGRIKARDTAPELRVRSALHRMGYRFRLHTKDLPGKPDIVLPKWRQVLFVHGCFWHRHEGCKFAYNPKTRPDFWQGKFTANAGRDRAVQRELQKRGWRVSIIWECETSKENALVDILDKLLRTP